MGAGLARNLGRVVLGRRGGCFRPRPVHHRLGDQRDADDDEAEQLEGGNPGGHDRDRAPGMALALVGTEVRAPSRIVRFAAPAADPP